jgi:hypothetical protein
MADKIVKITFEIDGLEQSVTNIDDAKVALEKLEAQAKETGNAAETAADDFDKLGDASKEAGEAGEGAISVLDEATGGLASRFKNVITGVGKMGKALKTSFKSGVAGASSLKKALISTGIGAIVVALGLIVAYWDDIKGLVSGVSSEQKKLNAEVEANVTKQQEALDALSLQENSLRLQGKSEAEIRDLKIEQTNEVIAATEAQLVQMQKTKEAQIAAAQRNKDIAQGVIRFLTLPITILLSTVDQLTKAISLIPGIDIGTNLEEGFSGGIAGMIFDPEEVAEEGDATIKETEAQLAKLKSTRDGYKVQQQKEDQAAAEKAKADREKADADDLAAAQKLAAEKKAIADKAAADKAAADAAYLANRQLIDDMLQQADLDSIDSMFFRAQEELRIQEETDIAKLEAAGATEAEINRIKASFVKKNEKLAAEEVAFNKEMKNQDVQNAMSAGSDILSSISSLVGEGTAVGKAAAIASTTIDTYASATAAYKSVVGIPVVGPALAPVAAGVAVAAGLMSIKKIVSTKTPGNKSAGSVPSITVPSAPPVNPETALQSGAAADQAENEVTLGNQTGSGGAPVVRAYVVSSEVTGQQEADAKINDLARL